MALIDDSPRSATVVALTDVTVAPIKEIQFLSGQAHADVRADGDGVLAKTAAPSE